VGCATGRCGAAVVWQPGVFAESDVPNSSGDLYKLSPLLSPLVHAFDILGDPVRRRILKLLADGEQTSGAVTDVIRAEFGISQPATSQHLRVLRDGGFASVRAEGTRRFYTVEPAPLREIDAWLDRFRRFWEQRLDAQDTELARRRRARRSRAVPTRSAGHSTDPGRTDPSTERT
jgi:DNA-binding transcriptional ArsR family regulator